jgi:hypothetical protein
MKFALNQKNNFGNEENYKMVKKSNNLRGSLKEQKFRIKKFKFPFFTLSSDGKLLITYNVSFHPLTSFTIYRN